MKAWFERLFASLLLIATAITSKCAGQTTLRPDTITARDTLAPVVCRQIIVKDTALAKGDTALMISFCAPMRWFLYHMNPHGGELRDPVPRKPEKPT
jgi:hypothetical protein